MSERTGFGSLKLDTPLEAAYIGGKGIVALNHYGAGTQTAAAKKHQWIAPVAGTIVGVRARLDTAPTGAAAIYDLNINGVTAYTTQANRPTVAIAANDATTTLPDVVAVAAGDRISVDCDQIGSGTAGSDLTFSVAIKAALVD